MEALISIFWLGLAVMVLAGMWKTFEKASRPGWGAIVPFYNVYLMCLIGGKPGWWLLLAFIPLVNVVAWLLVCLGIAENFGKTEVFAVGLWLVGFVFFPILGFGDALYKGARPTTPPMSHIPHGPHPAH